MLAQSHVAVLVKSTLDVPEVLFALFLELVLNQPTCTMSSERFRVGNSLEITEKSIPKISTQRCRRRTYFAVHFLLSFFRGSYSMTEALSLSLLSMGIVVVVVVSCTAVRERREGIRSALL